MKKIIKKYPPPTFAHSYPQFTQVIAGLLFFVFILVSCFALTGCGDEIEPFVSPIADNVNIQFVLEDTDTAILVKSNILAVDVDIDTEHDYWFVKFSLDSNGALAVFNATAPENQGKYIHVIVNDNIVASPCIGGQIANDFVTITQPDEQAARDLYSIVTTGHSLADLEHFELFGEYPR